MATAIRAARILAAVGAAAVGSCASWHAAPDGVPSAGPGRVAALYARHCAVCHGPEGGGDGPAARSLFPQPRDFGAGRFRLISTENGAPTDGDLIHCLARGMPGAAMPSFAWLPRDDVSELAVHVRRLAVERMATRLRDSYALSGRELGAGEARDVAVWRMTPGAEVPLPPVAEPTAEVLARGRALYLVRCAACHGADGEGQTPDRAWAEFDGLYWARDLRRGAMKGGARPEDLAHRILAGMPGVAMPPARFDDPSDAAAIVAFVRSLLPADADRKGVQRRQQLRAPRVPALPSGADDPAWAEAPSIDATLMPLAYRDACIGGAALQALHDGRDLAIRVSWLDPTRDDRAIGGASGWADQCAVQLSAEDLPPLFGMGDHRTPVNIWHWAAFRPRDVAGALDLLERVPHADRLAGAPTYLRVLGIVAPSGRADDLDARGVDAAVEVREAAIAADARYRDGRWVVVFTRRLDPGVGDGIELSPGGSAQLACAVWNGSAEDHGARKAISIWHELQIAR